MEFMVAIRHNPDSKLIRQAYGTAVIFIGRAIDITADTQIVVFFQGYIVVVTAFAEGQLIH